MSKSNKYTDIRRKYVCGKVREVGEGVNVYEDYSILELSKEYGIYYAELLRVSKRERWEEQRKLYLERLNEGNRERELGIRSELSHESEVGVLRATEKLSVVLDDYIEYRFGEILEYEGSIREGLVTGEISEDTRVLLERESRGIPRCLVELKECLGIASGVYSLQRKLLEDWREDQELRGIKSGEVRGLSEGERVSRLGIRDIDRVDNIISSIEW